MRVCFAFCIFLPVISFKNRIVYSNPICGFD